MSVSVLDMSISVDGFIADTDDYLGGEDGERLHAWAASQDPSHPVQHFEEEWRAAGAVLAGRRTAELMDHWGGSHAGVPIFVPSHRPPPPAARWGYPLVTYVADGIESAMAQAKAAAAGKDVHAAGAARSPSGPWRPGCSTRSRATSSPCCSATGAACSTYCPGSWSSSSVGVIDTPEATHIRYRVRR